MSTETLRRWIRQADVDAGEGLSVPSESRGRSVRSAQVRGAGAGSVCVGAAGEESAGGRHVPILCDEDVDDLAILLDRPVQIDPAPSDLDISLIDDHRSPDACRQGRAASISGGVNRCTHR